MRIDETDNSICTCEGGVWYYIENVAELTNASPDEIKEWINDNSHDIANYVNDCIVDTAIEKTAALYNSEHPKQK